MLARVEDLPACSRSFVRLVFDLLSEPAPSCRERPFRGQSGRLQVPQARIVRFDLLVTPQGCHRRYRLGVQSSRPPGCDVVVLPDVSERDELAIEPMKWIGDRFQRTVGAGHEMVLGCRRRDTIHEWTRLRDDSFETGPGLRDDFFASFDRSPQQPSESLGGDMAGGACDQQAASLELGDSAGHRTCVGVRQSRDCQFDGNRYLQPELAQMGDQLERVEAEIPSDLHQPSTVTGPDLAIHAENQTIDFNGGSSREVRHEMTLPPTTGWDPPVRHTPPLGGNPTSTLQVFMGNELETLRTTAEGCTDCRLSETRTNVVFGVGSADADVMIIGEAPGKNEDLQGEPFVGRAGQLLDSLMTEVGIERDQVYIANVLKCRPPGNRDPRPDEIEACKGYLHRQLELVAPVVVVTLGNFATKLLLKTETGITRMRGQRYRWWRGIIVVPTFHPAAALRGRPDVEESMRRDFALVKATIDELPPHLDP